MNPFPTALRSCVSAIFLLSAVGCVSTADFFDQPLAEELEVTGSYQANFARMRDTFRRCGLISRPTGFTGTSQAEYDMQLFPDLGYGEITSMMTGLTATVVYFQVVLREAGQNTSVEIRTGNMIPAAQSRMAESLIYWASGGTECDV